MPIQSASRLALAFARTLFGRTLFLLLTALGLGALSGAATADAPWRAARLGDVVGDVQLANERDNWHPIGRNHVITAGDNLWVSAGGRAELDIGNVQIWLAGSSNVYFEQFDDSAVLARLAQGAMIVRLRALDAGESYRVALPQGEVTLVEPGYYLFGAGLDYAPGTLSVRRGRAEAATSEGRYLVQRGETVVFDGIGLRPAVMGSGIPPGFEAWASTRDRRIDRWDARFGGQGYSGLIGLRDLDDYGHWSSSDEYGRVWFPTTVAANWAPYRFGRWSWVQPWGWTWIDDAPWGFAPSHYGRWVRVGGRWGWCPGEYAGRPVYAPALVTFFGGDGWRVSASAGPSFSWVPLAWNEPYQPWYAHSTTYWRQLNRPTLRGVVEAPWQPRSYQHAAVPGAVTVVPGATFLSGRPVAPAYVRAVPDAVLQTAPPVRIGEVLPQFASARHLAPGVVRGVPPAAPAVTPVTPPRPGEVNRFPASAAPRDYLPASPGERFAVPPPTRGDPNPVAGRPVAPPAPAPLSPNPALREPAIPMPKDRVPTTRPAIVEPYATPALPFATQQAPVIRPPQPAPSPPAQSAPRALPPYAPMPAAPQPGVAPAPIRAAPSLPPGAPVATTPARAPAATEPAGHAKPAVKPETRPEPSRGMGPAVTQ